VEPPTPGYGLLGSCISPDLVPALRHHNAPPRAPYPQVDLRACHLAALATPTALDQLGRGPRPVQQVFRRVELPLLATAVIPSLQFLQYDIQPVEAPRKDMPRPHTVTIRRLVPRPVLRRVCTRETVGRVTGVSVTWASRAPERYCSAPSAKLAPSVRVFGTISSPYSINRGRAL
jgi:hypothetical protein